MVRQKAAGKSGLTRRSLFGVGAAGLAAACATTEPAYKGKVEFKHGVASGDPLKDRVIIWTRVTPEAVEAVQVNWMVASDPGFKTIVRQGVTSTGPARDYTVKVDVDGLKAGTIYYYGFRAGSAVSASGITRTLPANGTDDFKIAVVSCSHYAFGFFNAYREIGKRTDIHAVCHVGDYIYEYGKDGYGGNVGSTIGRVHEPPGECIKLDDYRKRYAQYRADPDLQSAHARCPWFVTWDDHETANNSYATGAENHQPETEGTWSARKAAAVQCYLEWMPMRDPPAGKPREAIYRTFDIGDLATLIMLETRLIGRGVDTTYDEIFLAPENQRQAVADQIKAKLADPQRSMMGPDQEAWLAQELKRSVASGKKWQVLGNQVIMAKIRAPDLKSQLSPEQWAQINPGTQRFFQTKQYGLEWNPDAWSGFPTARERLYASAKAANAHLVVFAGDSHTAWANELHDKDGFRLGVEFGCTSITSNGMGDSVPFKEINWLMAEGNDEVVYYNGFDKGFTVVTLKADQVEAEYVKVSTIRDKTYFASTDARFIAKKDVIGMGNLQRSSGGGAVTRG